MRVSNNDSDKMVMFLEKKKKRKKEKKKKKRIHEHNCKNKRIRKTNGPKLLMTAMESGEQRIVNHEKTPLHRW